MPYGPFATLTDYLTFLELRRRDPDNLMLVLRDISRPTAPLAGVIGLLHTSKTDCSVEMGHIMIFPEFQVGAVILLPCLSLYLITIVTADSCCFSCYWTVAPVFIGTN